MLLIKIIAALFILFTLLFIVSVCRINSKTSRWEEERDFFQLEEPKDIKVYCIKCKNECKGCPIGFRLGGK